MEQFNFGPAAYQIANATSASDGLMSSADKGKLDGIAAGATAVTVNNTLTSDSTTQALSAAQGKVLSESIIKPVTIDLDTVTNTSGSYTHTTSISTSGIITEGMKCIGLEVGNPAAFKDMPTITAGTDAITLSCSSVSGTSTVRVIMMRTTQASSSGIEPTVITSEEFDILAGRIGTLANLTTTAKTDVVSAVNEVNSVKANRILLTDSDTLATIKTKFDEFETLDPISIYATSAAINLLTGGSLTGNTFTGLVKKQTNGNWDFSGLFGSGANGHSLNFRVASLTSSSAGTFSLKDDIQTLSDQIAHIDTSTTTNLSNIPVNSKGRIYLGSSVSPTGANAYVNYICYGSSDRRTIEVRDTSNNIWYNSYNGSNWVGWFTIGNATFGKYSETAITDLENVPANTSGYNLFTGGAHPSGGDGGSLVYWCFGTIARRVIIAFSASTGNAWTNTRNNSTTWNGWRKVTLTDV